MKKKRLLLWALILVVLASEGCATMRGMGEDIQSLELLNEVFSKVDMMRKPINIEVA